MAKWWHTMCCIKTLFMLALPILTINFISLCGMVYILNMSVNKIQTPWYGEDAKMWVNKIQCSFNLYDFASVQVPASTVKDVYSHYLWELIHLKSQQQRRGEKVYYLWNR